MQLKLRKLHRRIWWLIPALGVAVLAIIIFNRPNWG